MSTFYVSERDDLLEDTIDELKKYLQGSENHDAHVGVHQLFTNFGAVRVSAVHPFAIIQSAQANNQRIPAGLFPSVTISLPNETETQEHLAFAEEAEEVTDTMVSTWLNLEDSKRLISKQQLQSLRSAVQAGTVYSLVLTYRYSQQMAFSIWTENDIVTRTLYQLCRAFVNTHKPFFEERGFETIAFSGSPTGLYSTDLGRVMYGAEGLASGVNQTVDRIIDTSWVTINHIKHSVVHGDIMS